MDGREGDERGRRGAGGTKGIGRQEGERMKYEGEGEAQRENRESKRSRRRCLEGPRKMKE